jgi:hypothetical protein
MKLGDDIQILTDGEKIVIRKTEVPEIWLEITRNETLWTVYESNMVLAKKR